MNSDTTFLCCSLTCHCAVITHKARCGNCIILKSPTVLELCNNCKITCQNCILKHLFKDKLHLECKYNEKFQKYTALIYGFYYKVIEYIIPLNCLFDEIYCHDKWDVYIPLKINEKIHEKNFFIRIEKSLFLKRNVLYFVGNLPIELVIKIMKNMFY